MTWFSEFQSRCQVFSGCQVLCVPRDIDERLRTMSAIDAQVKLRNRNTSRVPELRILARPPGGVCVPASSRPSCGVGPFWAPFSLFRMLGQLHEGSGSHFCLRIDRSTDSTVVNLTPLKLCWTLARHHTHVCCVAGRQFVVLESFCRWQTGTLLFVCCLWLAVSEPEKLRRGSLLFIVVR